MAATITFRPRAGIREALDARCADGPDRSSVINAALAQYLGVGIDNGEVERPDPTMVSERGLGGIPIDDVTPKGKRRKARQAVPTVGEPPECPHPKEAIKKLPYGKQCTECGQMVR